MASPTPRLGLDRFDQGDDNWDHTDTVDTLDELAVETDTIANRPASGDYDDELYLATDQQILYQWDATASDWDAVAGTGTSSNPVPGTTYLNALEAGGLPVIGRFTSVSDFETAASNGDVGQIDNGDGTFDIVIMEA